MHASTSLTNMDKDQRLAWFREARFGMMITWGIYSLLIGIRLFKDFLPGRRSGRV